MSLNRITDSTIKPYLNLGCDKVNANRLLINNIDIINPRILQYTPNITCNWAGATVSNISAYSFTIGTQMHIYANCSIALIDPITAIFINVELPLLITGDQSKPSIGVCNFTSASATTTILSTPTYLHTYLQSATTIIPGTYNYNAMFVFTKL